MLYTWLSSSLKNSKRILISGAGGGFDIFCGLPLYFALSEVDNKEIFLGNLTFTNLFDVKGEEVSPAAMIIDETAGGPSDYFPEKYLCNWLALNSFSNPQICCFHRDGTVPIKQAYEALIDKWEIDTIILIDGGTDALMKGDEVGLGTPHEDLASIAAVDQLSIDTKLLVCLGFGIDRFHGINHAQFLENVAALTRSKDNLGTLGLLEAMPEVKNYISAYDYVSQRMPNRESIVNSSIISALKGEFGNYHSTKRTVGSELWINPLMTMYWGFNLSGVAKRHLVIEKIKSAQTRSEIGAVIRSYRESNPVKEWESIPL